MSTKVNSTTLTASLRSFFMAQPRVELAYLFGSTARGTSGPLSDVDVAVRFSPELARSLDARLKLQDALCRYLGSDQIDLVDLDEASPLLSYNVVRDGVSIKGGNDVRVPFEVRVMSEYFDTHALRAPHEAALQASTVPGQS